MGKAAGDPHSAEPPEPPDPPARAHDWRVAVRCPTRACPASSNRQQSCAPSSSHLVGTLGENHDGARCRHTTVDAKVMFFATRLRPGGRRTGQASQARASANSPTPFSHPPPRRCLLKHVNPAADEAHFDPSGIGTRTSRQHNGDRLLVGQTKPWFPSRPDDRPDTSRPAINSRCRPRELPSRVAASCVPRGPSACHFTDKSVDERRASKRGEPPSWQTKRLSHSRTAPRLPGTVISDIPMVDAKPGQE